MANKITLEAVLDASGIQRGVSQAQNSLGVLKGVVDGMLPFLSGAAFAGALKASYAEFAQDEQAINKLSRAVRNAGGDWGSFSGRINSTVRDMQYMTGFTDDQLNSALRRMVLATGDVEGSLTELGTAADVAAAYEIDLTTAASAVAAAMEGNYRKVTMLLPALRDLVKDGMSVVEVMKLIRDTTAGSAGAGMQGAAGSVKQLQLAIEDLKGSIGGMMNDAGVGKFFRAMAQLFRGDFSGSADQKETAERMIRNGKFWDPMFGITPNSLPATGEQMSWWQSQLPFVGPPSPSSYFQFPGTNPNMGASSAWKGWDAGQWATHWASFPDRPDIAFKERSKIVDFGGMTKPGETTGPMTEAFFAQESAVKQQLTNIFSSAITAGIHGSAKDIVRVFSDALVQAMAQKAGMRIADKLFGAAKGMAGPLGWLFG